MLLVLSMVSAFAQTVGTASTGTGSITISNAAKGETYKVVKLFDATIDATKTPVAIAYTGTIPTALANFFEQDTAGNISLKKVPDSAGKEPGDEGYVPTFYEMTATDFATMKTWADGIAAGDTTYTVTSVESDGTELTFAGLPYGYYVIVSTQGALVTVDSTTPDVTVIDKNKKEPSANKTVEPAHVSVGQTVTYTATFDAPNFLESTDDEGNQIFDQVVSYIIEDTLPPFLGKVKVTEVKIVHTPAQEAVEDDPATTDVDETQAAVAEVATTLTAADYQFTDKKIEIPWVREEVPTQNHKYTSLYKNGSQIVITYTATVTADADVGKGNVNKVSLKPQVDRGNGKEPYDDKDHWNDTATIYTHAVALQKKENAEDGDNLAGAEFAIDGLIVSGVPGFYTVVSYDPTSTTPGTIMKCDENGKLVIAGIDADSATPVKLTVTETTAPDGFNKIEGTFELTTTVMSTQTTTTHGSRHTWYDADGNIVDEEVTGGSSIERNEITAIDAIPAENIQPVVNKSGAELPSTGGIGTTIFYVAGSILVLAAVVLLVTKRRMSAGE